MPIKIIRRTKTPAIRAQVGLEAADEGVVMFVCEAWRVMKGAKLISYLGGFGKVTPNDGLVADLQFLQALVPYRDGT